MYTKEIVSHNGTIVVHYDRSEFGEILHDRYWMNGIGEFTDAFNNLCENGYIPQAFFDDLCAHADEVDKENTKQDAFEMARSIAEDHMSIHR
ncbi:hypothetical protein KAR91_40480 [Candidatus Pacearchaeota archaeon]|nr:hypothetical protein [Candidatus Pacearchaeota archaeon]